MNEVCPTCQGLGRVCWGNRVTMRIERIEKCHVCGGTGWAPDPTKKRPEKPPEEQELPLV